MTAQLATDETPDGPSACWCCGMPEDATRMVHLGKHPEVTLCIRCAQSISKMAREIEDRARTGFAVRARDQLRSLRKTVVDRGWQHNKAIGRPLRWLGKHTP